MKTLYRLPTGLRSELRNPFAPILSERELLESVNDGTLGRPIVCVGDVVSATLIKAGLAPDIVIYDLSTQRGAIDPDIEETLLGHKARRLEATSPPAEITEELVMAVRIAFQSAMMTKIHVRGEEDLAGLPAIKYCPDGGTVIYGMPNRGLVAVPVDATAKARAERLLSLMKVGDAPEDPTP